MISFIDLFAGIGGFRHGLERANDRGRFLQEKEEDPPVQKYLPGAKERQARPAGEIGPDPQQGLGDQKGRHISRTKKGRRREFQKFHCVWSNEWDKYARQIYKKHWGECDGRDIRTVPSREIPDHDLLCAGFPCQSFSVAGKRAGFEDTRGTLFFEIARIARDKRPRYLLLENVKGLLSHQEGKTFQTILGVLSDLGYRVEWQVLNSRDFGVPQNRERVFIVGHLGGEPRPKVFPISQSSQGNLKYSVGVISAREKWIKGSRNLSREFSQGQRIYSEKGIAQTLVKAVLTPDRPKKRQHGRRFKEDGEPSFTLTGQDIHGVSDGTKIRRLTPTECERLQGFPDGWTEGGVSDTQRYKMLGNAVTVSVVEAIGRRLREIYGQGKPKAT